MYPVSRLIDVALENRTGKPKEVKLDMKRTTAKGGKFGTNGGNGGYAKRKAVTDLPQKPPRSKKPYTYAGKDVRKASRNT